MGVFRRMFIDINGMFEDGYDGDGQAAFRANGVNVRQLTGRNTPTVFNSVFTFATFGMGGPTTSLPASLHLGTRTPGRMHGS